MGILVFEVTSEYARFRKPFTTTSTQTYKTICPTHVRGLIGAILGIDRRELHTKTADIKLAVSVCNDINKDTQSFNYTSLGNEDITTFQAHMEFLRDVKYKIYVEWDDENLSKLEYALARHRYEYSPYLGASEHLAKIELLGLFESEKLPRGVYKTSCVVSEDSIIELVDFSSRLHRELIPISSDKNREYNKYSKVVYVTGGKELEIESENCIKVGDDYIVFL